MRAPFASLIALLVTPWSAKKKKYSYSCIFFREFQRPEESATVLGKRQDTILIVKELLCKKYFLLFFIQFSLYIYIFFYFFFLVR